MATWDVQSVLLVIAAVAGGLKLLIDAIYGGKKLTEIRASQIENQQINSTKLDESADKLEEVHQATNGGWAAVNRELQETKILNQNLLKEIIELKKKLPIVVLFLLLPINASAQATSIDPDLAWKSNQRVADIISYATTGTAIGIDIFHAARSDNPKRALAKIGIKDGSIIGISELVKAVIHRSRPDKSDNKSFYSEHTALSFSCAGKCLYFGVSTAYLRTAANKHYLTDVLVGGLVGAGMNFATKGI